MEADNARNLLGKSSVYVVIPPPVPSSRGPSLKNGARPVGGPPRTTPRRRSASNTFRFCRAGEGDDDDDNLPSALPPPKPHPAVMSARFIENGEKAASRKRNVELAAFGNSFHSDAVKAEIFQETPGQKKTNVTLVGPAVATEGARAVSVLSLPIPQLPVKFLLSEVSTFMGIMKNCLNFGCCQKFLRKTEEILDDMRREVEELCLRDAEADKELCEAKLRYVASLDCNQLQQGCGGVQWTASGYGNAKNKKHAGQKVRKNDANDEDEAKTDDCAPELEAWRIEKGKLLAEKVLLLQKKMELQHQNRRGTNIKTSSGLVAPRDFSPTQQRMTENNNDNSNSDGDSDSAPCVSDLETIRLRLEVKEAQVRLENILASHGVAEDTQRARRNEMESQMAALREKLAAAKKENEAQCMGLRGVLKDAERLRGLCQRAEEDSLLLLEQRINEALAVLNARGSRPESDTCETLMSSFSRCSSVASIARRPSLSLSSAPLHAQPSFFRAQNFFSHTPE